MPITGISTAAVLRDPSSEDVRAYRARGPLVVLNGDATLLPVLTAGSSAYGWALLALDAGADAIDAAARAVEAGLVVLSPAAARALPSASAPSRAAARGDLDHVERLTTRERDVLQLVAQGLHNRAIATALGISDHTVKFHLASIFGKLGASTRTEAARIGLKQGLVQI